MKEEKRGKEERKEKGDKEDKRKGRRRQGVELHKIHSTDFTISNTGGTYG